MTTDELTMIDEGIYQLKFIRYETLSAFKTGKLRLDFEIIDYGPAFGLNISRFYNVTLSGKPKVNGKFRAGWHSECVREYVQLFRERPERRDRINWNRLKNKLVKAKIRYVNQDYKQRPKLDLLRNSVVDELLEIVS